MIRRASTDPTAPRPLIHARELRGSLDDLQEGWQVVGTGEEVLHVRERIRDLEAPLLLFVVGEGNFGKSSVINAVAGVAVAPVSLLPRTWKVDLYEAAASIGEERALLRWEGTDRDESMDIDSARSVVEKEEAAARSMRQARRPGEAHHRSGLVQVRWRRAGTTLPGDVVMVDTPGFAQVRRDLDLRDLHLRSARGIQIEAREPFEYWYHRADVVLWVFKATKLNDRDTHEALRLLAPQGKPILGVITHMDRVPREQWPEVLAEAHRHFGEFVDSFLPVVAAEGRPGYPETVADLQRELAERFFEDARLRKSEAVGAFLRHSGNRLVKWGRAIHGALGRNLDLHQKSSAEVASLLTSSLQGASEEIERWQMSSSVLATGRCNVAFEVIPETDARLREEIEEILRPNAAVKELHQRLEQRCHRAAGRFVGICSRMELVGVKLGREGAETFIQPVDLSSLHLPEPNRIQLNIRIDDAISGREGTGTAIVAGAVGIALFGPLGIAAAFVGAMLADPIKRGKLRAYTQRMMHNWFAVATQRAAAEPRIFLRKASREVSRMLDTTFEEFCGAVPEGARRIREEYEREILKKFAARHARRRRGGWTQKGPRRWPRRLAFAAGVALLSVLAAVAICDSRADRQWRAAQEVSVGAKRLEAVQQYQETWRWATSYFAWALPHLPSVADIQSERDRCERRVAAERFEPDHRNLPDRAQGQ